MKRLWATLLMLTLLLPLLSQGLAASSPVPDEIPEDLGGKTVYGFLVDLRKTYLPNKVFADTAKYTDQDREDARKAIELIVRSTTAIMEAAEKEDSSNLYLRAWALDLSYQDTGDPQTKQQSLEDYRKTIEKGDTFAQADYDRLLELEVMAAPLHWHMAQMLTPEELGEILGVPGASLSLVRSAYEKEDSSRRAVGYVSSTAAHPALGTIHLIAEPQGGSARFKLLSKKENAFLGRIEPLEGLGDEAVAMMLVNKQNNPLRYAALLVRKGDLVLQAWVPAGFHGMDAADAAREICSRVLSNMDDVQRPLPPPPATLSEPSVADVLPKSDAGASPVPDVLPEDLGGKTEYGFVLDILNTHIKKEVFSDPKWTEEDRNNARRAIRLVVETLNTRFDISGQDVYQLEMRGKCYSAAYDDTGNPLFRDLAINDYKQSMIGDFYLAKKDYDRLATPVLSSLGWMGKGDQGAQVSILQQWLNQAGYPLELSGMFDAKTAEAVQAYRKDHGLQEDGGADLAFLLSLYAKVP